MELDSNKFLSSSCVLLREESLKTDHGFFFLGETP